jgi:PAS domain S-box-containing protein
MTPRKLSPKRGTADAPRAGRGTDAAMSLLDALDPKRTRSERLAAAAKWAAAVLGADAVLVAIPPEHPRGRLAALEGLDGADGGALPASVLATHFPSPLFRADSFPPGTALRLECERLGFVHGICVPFDDGMGAPGVFAVFSAAGDGFDSADAELLSRVSAQVGGALTGLSGAPPPGAKQAGPLVTRAFALLDVLPDPVFRVRRDGTVLDFWATRFTESVSETSRITGRSIFDVLSPESAQAVRVCIDAALVSGRPQKVEYAHALRGRLRIFEARVAACGPDEVVAAVRDASRARRRITERECMRRLSHGLAGAATAREVARALADQCRALFSHEVFSFDLFEQGERRLKGILAEDTPPGGQQPQEVEAPDVEGLSDAELALFTPGSQLINRWEEPTTPVLLAFGFSDRRARSLLCMTATHAARRFLRCTVQSYTPGRYSDADLRAFQRMVDETMPALMRAVAEDELRLTEERFRLVANSVSDVIVEWDPGSSRIHYTAGDTDELASKIGTLPGDYAAWEQRLHPEDRDAVVAAFKRHMATGEPYHVEYRIRLDDATWRFWEVHGTAMRDETGTVRRWVGAITDVTDRRHAEAELRDQREKLEEVQKQRRAILHSSPNGLCLLEPDWSIALANRAAHILLNPLDATNRPLAKVNLSEFFAEGSEFTSFRRDATAALRQSGLYRGEHRMKRLGGDFIWIEIALARVDPGETATGMVATLTDISHRKRTEAALEAAEFTQRALIEQSLVGVCVVQDDKFAYANPRLAEMLGYTPAEMVAMPSVYDIAEAGDRQAIRDRVAQRLSGNTPRVRYETRLIRKDGRLIEADVSGSVVQYLGRPALMSVVLDMTEQRRAAREREALSQMLLLLSAADTVEKVADIVYEACLDLFGMDSFRLSLRDPNSVTFRSAILMDTVDGTRHFFPVQEFVDADRSRLGNLWLGEPVLINRLDANDGPFYETFGDRSRRSASLLQAPVIVGAEMLGVLAAHSYTPLRYDDHDRDLLQRLADAIGPALERCRAERAYHRVVAAIEQSTDGIILTDPDWRAIYVNPAFVRMTGYAPEDILGVNPRDLLKPVGESAEQQVEIAETLARGEPWTGEWKCRRKDGTEFDERVTLCPITDDGGNVVNYLAVRRDISREIALESEMRQAHKMEAAGMLAGGVAHDFNNILQIIMGYTQILIRRLTPDDPVRADLEAISRATRRGASLARQLLAFSRKQLLQPRNLSLNPIVSDMQKMLRRLIGEDVELVTHLEPDLHRVLADPGQIEQVILNLAVNARDAMPDGGRLYMETRNATVPSPLPASLADISPGEYACIIVSDTGHGMSHETMQRAFEPFFTTKEPGKGTGLGLSTAYGILRQSGGAITVESTPGGGASFTIYLPKAEAPPTGEPSEGGAGTAATGTETILLVEDEDEVRKLVAAMLEGLGYTILQARTGIEGLRLAEETTSPVHLVLADVVMPGMSGPNMVRQVMASHPETRVIYMSGYTDSAAVQQVQGDPDAVLLNKPVSPGMLARRIREMLDSKR